MGTIREQAANLRQRWATDPRWAGIERTYSAEDVIRLRGSVVEECAPARLGAARLWDLLNSQDAVRALGAASGSQAVRMVSAGLQAFYLSARHAPADPAPTTVRRINRALLREGPAVSPEDASAQHWLAPVVSDAEAGCGEVLNAFELMTDMIEAGAAGVHFDDQLSGERKGGQLGGKVLIPTGQHIKALNAARLAADVLDVPALVIARTAAIEATLLTSDADERDHEFLTGEQTAEGLHRVRPGLYACVTRGLAFAPYADLLWLETGTPDLAAARAFAQIIHSQYPDKMLAYSCSPSCDWSEHPDVDIEKFQKELAVLGYRFQFVTPAGFDVLDQPVSGPASGGVRQDVSSFIPRQEAECSGGALGYSATAGRRESEAGTGYHDLVTRALTPETLIATPAVPVETAHFVGHDQLDHHGRLVPAD